MDHCPRCESHHMLPVRHEEGCRVYVCQACQHSVETTEVLTSELRRLLTASLELTRLQVSRM